MKFIIALALICIIGAHAAEAVDAEIAPVIKKMESSKYGKTLLDTIAL